MAVEDNYYDILGGVAVKENRIEKFFRNLLLGENNELKNRYMVICPPDELASPDKFKTSNENIVKTCECNRHGID